MKLENPTPIDWKFSVRAEQLQSSVIREILKVTMRPEVISFAGGLPSPETFPVERMKAAFDKVLSTQGKSALQYGPTDGYAPLREFLAASLSTADCSISPDQILMVSGSQQGLDLLGKVLIDEGSKILVETPSYLGALQAFSVYQPEFVSVDTDENGVLPASVAANGAGARLMYALPNFQNPTGRTLSLERRLELVETCARMGIPLIEDNPYGDLCYTGEPLPKMLNMNPAGVIYMGSFSKVLTPGIRLGYVVGPVPLIRKLEQAKQAADLHTAQLTQMVVYEVIKDGFLDQHIPTIRTFYAGQCAVMLDALSRHFPVGVEWTHPEGGMFIWVTLPAHIDSKQLLDEAIQQNVAFVPGGPFYANEGEKNTLRLSFVTVSPERINEGIEKLAKLIKAKM
ncbi:MULTISPECIES: PLP-dependent aminotransferase family protein [unclassified Undibacterium]|uniref:aminotransferase-like domain-containing protein n=1 Tax=unclassified Undibacterium TaxID=2630295 RepID=UPI002AC9CA2A|nr:MULTISPECIES: PLP-dependent aminotransferase family protein [unclassified Undibacterium]MEB0138183.1 PLP-dependent aminotransferase family protein [Undibacterium sp. CCC2.1]MEB0171062.1 PLP-dependent aminotransferase family protein [Undibacterium sp. CCC1.1]MEB0175107.1 PLP-dependent aminotransferase family protein [Undibacterium sp. CCC3.4]MEB0214309.1 PLP-dependent aminotransferase family protein [Undibacterium sp. 5I2]WPX41889.1 PLP-dependent aminotransferase family protein [Undibacteriu